MGTVLLRSVILLAILTAFSQGSPASDEGCLRRVLAALKPVSESEAAGISQQEKIIENNGFKTTRTLFVSTAEKLNGGDNWVAIRDSYEGRLGKAFFGALRSLTNTSRWIDVGGGRSLWAVDYFGSPEFSEKAEVVSISATVPDRTPEENETMARVRNESGGKFRELHGKYIEEYAVSDVGSADLVTDVYGALTYSPHIDLVLQKYANLLRPGGKLFAVPPDCNLALSNGTPAYYSWLRSIRGLKVVDDGRSGTLILERTTDPIFVPPLVLDRFIPGIPPSRTYRWFP